MLNCQKRTQITFKFAILLFLAAKDGEREREREGKAVMMVHPFNTVKVLFSEKSLRKCFVFLFRVRLYQVKESHGNEEKSILISMKCVWLWNGSFCDATRGTDTSCRLLKNATV